MTPPGGLPTTRDGLRRIRLLLLLLLQFAWAAAPLPTAHATVPFEAEVRAFEAADALAPPPAHPAVFVGSSTFTRWTGLAAAFPGYQVLNRGFGGSQFRDVLQHFDRVVAAYRPSLLVVYEGDNDLAAGLSVDEVFAAWTLLADRVERDLPGTGILFLTVKPSPSRRANLPAQQALNARIAEDCRRRPGCAVADVATPMLDAAGEPRPGLFVSDQLHLNDAGYALWRQVLGPRLEAWAAAHPERSIRSPAGTILVDFGTAASGSAGTTSNPGAVHWNNLNASVGSSSQARLERLVTTAGQPTEVAWLMTSRFNGVNQNGTTAPAPFPTTATRDSLFGNTETFSGLANVTPAFRLTGLRPGVPHQLTFYASRTGVGDNRETRYTVTGATTASADLDVANNVAAVARLDGLEPAPDGSLAIALTPGPRNNNANHFTYLGVLRLEESLPGGRAFLVDVGGADSPTGTEAGPPITPWNDLTTDLGTTANSTVTGLVSTAGTRTGIALRILSPFLDADTHGTTLSPLFPASATRDSLVGPATPPGTGPQGSPAFQIGGLDARHAYTLGFFASRTGTVENLETRFRVRGSGAERSATLNPANNQRDVARIDAVLPDPGLRLEAVLEPGPANTSADRSPRLGVLTLEWRERETPPPPTIEVLPSGDGRLQLRVRTALGRAGRLEFSPDLVRWLPDRTVRPGEAGADLSWPLDAPAGFLRVRDVP